MKIEQRAVPAQAFASLTAAGHSSLIARLLAGRGVRSAADLRSKAAQLAPPEQMLHIDAAAALLADVIAAGSRIVVVGDYDCDGATATAVALRGLRAMGARVDYLVPDRFRFGYGLSPAIADLVAQHPRLGGAELLITVDNGIASIDGVARARALGMRVLVTDHHLPGAELPRADVIVNPHQPGCGFPSKALAGVGVIFYVLLALRSELRRRGAFAAAVEPPLQTLLDLVALGTVADMVRLDANNRLLVELGLRRIRAGLAQPGIIALFAAAGRAAATASARDLGFSIGPRINAAGRLQDIGLGIECLLSDDWTRAQALANELDQVNRQRRSLQQQMTEQARLALDELTDLGQSVTLFRPDWHQGVIGLVASQIREATHRPVIAFAPAGDGSDELRGSGRSIPGIHLRDVLDLISKREPQLLRRFGGHAMAAGLTIASADLACFERSFAAAVAQFAEPELFSPVHWTDGELTADELTLGSFDAIATHIWGQGFPDPSFVAQPTVRSQRLVGTGHLKLELELHGRRVPAIAFNRSDPVVAQPRLVYQLGCDEYLGRRRLALTIERFAPTGALPGVN